MSVSLSHPQQGDVNRFVLTIRTFDVQKVGHLDVVEKAVGVLFDFDLFKRAKREVPYMGPVSRLPPGFRIRYNPDDMEFGWVVEKVDAQGVVVAKIGAACTEAMAMRFALTAVGR